MFFRIIHLKHISKNVHQFIYCQTCIEINNCISPTLYKLTRLNKILPSERVKKSCISQDRIHYSTVANYFCVPVKGSRTTESVVRDFLPGVDLIYLPNLVKQSL